MMREEKIDAKSIIFVLLGVSEESKAYRLYDPVVRKVIVSRDVVFEEDKSWSWDESYKEHIIVHLEWDDSTTTNTKSEEAVSGNEWELIKPIGSLQNDEYEERNGRALWWMIDYVTGEGLLKELEEDNANIISALFASTDPTHFEEAMKHDDIEDSQGNGDKGYREK